MDATPIATAIDFQAPIPSSRKELLAERARLVDRSQDIMDSLRNLPKKDSGRPVLVAERIQIDRRLGRLNAKLHELYLSSQAARRARVVAEGRTGSMLPERTRMAFSVANALLRSPLAGKFWDDSRGEMNAAKLCYTCWDIVDSIDDAGEEPG